MYNLLTRITFFLCILFPFFINGSVYFIHIPSSGGTTVHSILENNFHQNEIHPIRDERYLPPGYHFDSGNYKLISGHFSYSLLKKADPNLENSFVFTTLRHPIDRLVSEYFYYKKAGIEKDLLENPSNVMCLQLASNPNLKGEDLLNDALSTLEKLDHIVFMDNFESDLQDLILLLNLSLYENSLPRMNHSQRKRIDESTLQELKKRNSLDIRLYNAAKKLNISKVKNKCVVKSEYTHELKQPSDKVSYTFDMPLIGKGWFYRENYNTNQPIYRWIRGREASIFFNLYPRNDYRLKFQASKLSQEFSLQVFVNGKNIPIRRINNSQFSLYESTENFSITKEDLTEIKFASSDSSSFCEVHPQTRDDRNLSIALNYIEIYAE